MRPRWIVALSTIAIYGCLFGITEGEARASTATVVVRSAGKTSGSKELARALITALESRGMKVVSDKVLSKKSTVSEENLVAEARGDMLVTVTVRKVKKRYVADAKLIDIKSGRTVKKAEKRYKKPSSAAAIGAALAQELTGGRSRVAEEEQDEEPPASPTRKPTARVEEEEEEEKDEKEEKEEKDEVGDETAAESPRKPSVLPKDESETVVASAAEKDAPTNGAESKAFRVSLAGGSQIASAYTVSVQTGPTQLAYRLNPLILVEGGLNLRIPSIGLGAEISLVFVPVKYQVDVTPAVDPSTPAGRFLDIGALAFYQLNLSQWSESSRFFVAPLVGFEYATLSVQAQQPKSIVLSWAMTIPVIGARLGLSLERLALELDGRARVVASYKEAPDNTGTEGSGLGFLFSGGARFWTTQRFGVFGRAQYLFSSISLEGAASRKPFAGDPPLENAKIANSELRLSVGVLLAL